ncbi:30S ribosomal protein S7 [Fibrobacterota bacterium]
MSRRTRAEKRKILPDAKYKSIQVTQFVNVVLQQGKRDTAEQIVYSAMDFLKKKVGSKDNEVSCFKVALENVKPSVEVKSRRVGGANYQVPIEVPQRRSSALALRWIVDAAKKRGEKDMSRKLGSELLQAYNNEGAAVRKKVETHKMADSNKAFAHFRY